MSDAERARLFEAYFAVFPFSDASRGWSGFDLGCGSGRWAALVAPRVGRLTCIDASPQALEVARRNLAHLSNCDFRNESVGSLGLPDASQDFGYSLGVLHHVPDTARALASCAAKLKPGAPFLVYLYYAFDNRPLWFRALWRASDVLRRGISRLPRALRHGVSDLIAALIYWPLARIARLASRLRLDTANWPLSFYAGRSFYVMRNDALDRFGTRLEQRFTRAQVDSMMRECGFEDIVFSSNAPYWCALGYKKLD
jgi:SAM-dependent methyltransferase